MTDLAGASLDTLASTLLSKKLPRSTVAAGSHVALLVAPAYTIHSLDLLCSADPPLSNPRHLCLDPVFVDADGQERTFGVHVDMDRLDELRLATWRTAGVGVWAVRR